MTRTRQQGYWNSERQNELMVIIGDKPNKERCDIAAKRFNKKKDNYRNFSWYELWQIAEGIIKQRKHHLYHYVDENGNKVTVYSAGYALNSASNGYMGI